MASRDRPPKPTPQGPKYQKSPTRDRRPPARAAQYRDGLRAWAAGFRWPLLRLAPTWHTLANSPKESIGWVAADLLRSEPTRNASQCCERMLESSSSPSAIVHGTNLLSGWWSAEIPKEFRGYGRRPVACAYGGKAGIRSLSADILRTS
jgi:hypothetical protein